MNPSRHCHEVDWRDRPAAWVFWAIVIAAFILLRVAVAIFTGL